jgi:hypothetical protein
VVFPETCMLQKLFPGPGPVFLALKRDISIPYQA